MIAAGGSVSRAILERQLITILTCRTKENVLNLTKKGKGVPFRTGILQLRWGSWGCTVSVKGVAVPPAHLVTPLSGIDPRLDSSGLQVLRMSALLVCFAPSPPWQTIAFTYIYCTQHWIKRLRENAGEKKYNHVASLSHLPSLFIRSIRFYQRQERKWR